MAADLTCEVLPTKHDVINSLFDAYEANNTMDEEGAMCFLSKENK